MLAPAAFAAETVQYAYDAAGRLTQADYGGARIDYVYDANGSAPVDGDGGRRGDLHAPGHDQPRDRTVG